MKTLGFGQPDDSIIQMAYVVADLDAAIASWRERFGIGPWFTLKDFAGLDARYRGAPARGRADVGFAFAGHMQIELIAQTNDAPSHFRRDDGTLRLGFHHFGVAASDFAAESAKLEAEGYEKLFGAVVPSGGRVAVYDTSATLPGMIELIESDADLDRMFTMMYEASVGWDGSDPVRDLAGAFLVQGRSAPNGDRPRRQAAGVDRETGRWPKPPASPQP